MAPTLESPGNEVKKMMILVACLSCLLFWQVKSYTNRSELLFKLKSYKSLSIKGLAPGEINWDVLYFTTSVSWSCCHPNLLTPQEILKNGRPHMVSGGYVEKK